MNTRRTPRVLACLVCVTAGMIAPEAQAQGPLPPPKPDEKAKIAGACVAAPDLPPTMRWRVGASRALAGKHFGMKEATEKAVVRGLVWLHDRQNKDGSWGDKNKGAMTGLALLCFLGHGELADSPEHGAAVQKAVQWILVNGTKSDGRLSMDEYFTPPGVYEHGICTLALGEYYTMSKDARVLELYKKAVAYIINGQSPAGGWMYKYDRTANDLSVSSWQIQALKVAHLSGLNLPGVDRALDKALEALARIWKGSDGYGYRGPENRYSLTGAGIYSHLQWNGDRGVVRKSMEWVIAETEKLKGLRYLGETADLYAWYYHTQAARFHAGNAWTRWNQWCQDELVRAQNPDGSWPAPGSKSHGPQSEEGSTGQTYRSALCILMLETYYRYVPLQER